MQGNTLQICVPVISCLLIIQLFNPLAAILNQFTFCAVFLLHISGVCLVSMQETHASDPLVRNHVHVYKCTYLLFKL